MPHSRQNPPGRSSSADHGNDPDLLLTTGMAQFFLAQRIAADGDPVALVYHVPLQAGPVGQQKTDRVGSTGNLSLKLLCLQELR